MALTNAQNTLVALKDRIAFFKELKPEEVIAVTKNVKFVRNMKTGDKIFEQGDYSKELYFVVQGSMNIEISKKEGKETKWISVAMLPKKALVGEMAFITGEPRSARASAGEDGTSILSFDIIDKPDIHTVFILSNIHLYFAKDMAEKLKHTTQKYAKVKSSSDIPYDDLLGIFVKSVEKVQEAANNNVLTIPKEVLDKANELLKDVDDPDVAKETIKTVVIEAYKLRDKDVIIMTKNKIVIRLFQDDAAAQTKKKVSSASEEDILLKSSLEKPEIFGKNVLDETSEEKLESKIIEICEKIFTDSPHRKKLNFQYMNDYDEFTMLHFVKPLVEQLWKMVEKYALEKLKVNPKKYEKMRDDKENQTLMLKLARKFISNYRAKLSSMVAATFIEEIGKLEKAASESGFLEGIIKGTPKHQSILIGADNLPVATKLQQVWMRTQQAKKKREEDTKDIRADYLMYKSQTEGYENSIKALHRAKHLTVEDVKDWGHEELRDFVTDDDFKEDKRLLQYIPSGEITNILMTRAEKGPLAAKNEMAKEDYERTLNFMEVLHSNNTEQTLDYKLEELYENKDKKERLMYTTKDKLEREMKKDLAKYDEALSRMKDAVMFNIVQTLK
ncbi:MAG: cyclic nucleotide-binding domain-containing protein, partial [Campylobacterales bacterium]|nr:cyclic nucleotide-binding domain-containing protein [Campylobacterales bacterium]